MSVPGLTRAAIRAGYDSGSFDRGARYQREGRVAELSESTTPYGRAVSGTVIGRAPYEVYVSLEDGRTGPIIESDCTCPVGYDCKHAVALLLEYVERGAAATEAPARQGAEARLRELVATSLRAARAPDVWPSHVHDRLLFVLDAATARDGRRGVGVALVAARMRDDERGYSRSAPITLRRVLDDYRPAYVLRSDVELVRRLVASGEAGADTYEAVVLPCGAAPMLEPLLATGRCHWRTPATPPLEEGAPRAARPVWRLAEDGVQVFDWHLDPPPDRLLPLAPPWYIDVERNECGRVKSALPDDLAARLAAAPGVAPEEVDHVASRLAEAAPRLPRPAPLEVVDLPAVRPTPCLDLHVAAQAGDDVSDARRASAHARRAAARARLRFRYDDRVIDAGDGREMLASMREGQVERLARNREAEAAAMSRLRAAGLVRLAATSSEHGTSVDLVPAGLDDSAGWVRFLSRVRVELEAEGWDVAVAAEFPYEVVHADAWYGDVHAERSSDWFGVDLGVVVDGERLPLLPLLKEWLGEEGGARARLDALEAGSAVDVALQDGRHLILPAERVGTILTTLVELYDADTSLHGDRLRLPRWRAMALEAPEGVTWQGAEDLRAGAERLRAAGGVERAPVPAGLKAELRGYQQIGLDWLQFLRAYGLAGVLADDMGLGKTVQVLAHLLLEKESARADRPSLVVVPTSLLANWRREAAAFAPDLCVTTWHGPERRTLLEHGGLDACDVVLTTYTLLARDREVLAEQPFHLLVLDEAQYVKNPRTHAAQAARSLDARHRLCLTGTPLENHLGEAWSLFDFLLPGLLGSERQFKRLFRTPIEKGGDDERREHLQRRVAPFLMRRRKDDVLTELPPKTEILRTVELRGSQRDLYESIRLAMHHDVREAIEAQGLDRSRIVVLDALLKLRQVCCDPRLVKLERARLVRESAKLELLMTVLPAMIEEGRRVLLFSQFTSMLALIQEAVREAGIDYALLTGRTRDRAGAVDRFQEGHVPLFLISLKAGGTGLNLTAADTVIHYDPWWNPAVETQASDRAHRIGQDRPVFVYKLVTQGTVEERIVALQEHKRALAEGLFAEGARTGALSPEDIEALFAPLE